MNNLIGRIECICENSSGNKVRYPLCEIMLILFLSAMSEVRDWHEWEDIAAWANKNTLLLKKYIPLKNGVPTSAAMRRIMSMISTEYLKKQRSEWNEQIKNNTGKVTVKEILGIKNYKRDMHRNSPNVTSAVTACVYDDGYCIGRRSLDRKQRQEFNFTEFPDILNIKKAVVTLSAEITSAENAEKITAAKGDYIFGISEKQPNVYKDISLYFTPKEHLAKIKDNGGYVKNLQYHGRHSDMRRYYQTGNTRWVSEREEWSKMKSIGMITRTQFGVSTRSYYISSLKTDIGLFSRLAQPYDNQWLISVNFSRCSENIVESTAAENRDIIRKWGEYILKKAVSENGRYMHSDEIFSLAASNSEKYAEYLLSF